jgi:hypothetical protein
MVLHLFHPFLAYSFLVISLILHYVPFDQNDVWNSVTMGSMNFCKLFWFYFSLLVFDIRIKGSCKVSPYTFHCVVAFVGWTLVEFLHGEFKANGKEPYLQFNSEISCEWKLTWPSKVGVISQYKLPLKWVYKTFHWGSVFYNSSTTLCQNCYYERKYVPNPLLFNWWKIGMFNSLYY